jgi:general nucleoside transport system ATP-binding protein
LADTYGLRIDPDAYIWQLSVGQQQRVEIIKALYRGAALLILMNLQPCSPPKKLMNYL